MKNLQRLIQLYAEDERVKQLISALQSDKPARLQLVGMVGAQEAFVLTGSYLASPRSHLFIAADKEEAAYLYNSCLLYTSPSPRDATLSRMPSSA